MKITVTKDNVKIEEFDVVHEGEHRVNKCSFSFSEEYTEELVKKAIFTSQNSSIEVAIINNECNIPTEILKARNIVLLGVYAYKVVDDKLDLRYSPSPDAFKVNSGSYIEGASESEEITPSQFEQYMQALNDGLNKVEESIKKMDEATSSATQLVDDINQKLENGDFIGPQGPEGPQGIPGKDGTNGKDGADGVGITTITSGKSTVEEDKTITPVTVQKSDGSSQSFKVEAKNGIDGQNGKDGVNGQDGLTPTIGENGNWFLGDTDTGKPSRGEVGPSPDLSNYVKNTDYAKDGKAGVVTPGNNLLVNQQTGMTYCRELSVEQYKDENVSGAAFVAKKTLQNIRDYFVGSSTPVITLNNTLDNLVRKNRVSDYIISLKDALKYKVFEFLVHAKVKQESTTGKNLLNYTNIKPSGNNLTNNLNDDGSITTIGTPNSNYSQIINSSNMIDLLEDGETYTIMQMNPTNKLYLQMTIQSNNGSPTYVALNNNTKNTLTFTVDKSSNNSYSIGIQTNTIEVTGEIDITNYYQLLKGSYDEWQPFEKYTRGQPSPNPDYPQEISTLTFDKITRCGKNLFDKDTVPDLLIYPHTDRLNSTTDNYSAIFKCLPNTTYSISKTSLSTTSLIVCGTKDYPETGDFTLNRQVYSNSNIANGYTTTEDTNYLVIRYCNPEDTLSHSEIFSTIQIEFGPQATDYEAYQATEYTIDLQGNEMVELPNGVQNDLIIDKQGNVSLIKNVGKAIYTNMNNFSNNGQNNKRIQYLTPVIENIPLSYGNQLDNIFKSNVISSIYVQDGTSFAGTTATSKIRVSISREFLNIQEESNSGYLNALDELLQSLNESDNPFTIYYPLETPEAIPLGKLTELITTEEGSNNFFINGNLETTLEVLYALDIKKYIDNKIAEISSALIEEG